MTPAAAGVTARARRTATRLVATLLVVAAGLGGCSTGDDRPVPSPSTPFTERWRPQFHYSPPDGRLADPNGLVFDAGEWHLFHQQDGTWAHAVSPDAVHWTALPTALRHDGLGQALSGSAVVDRANTSGLFDGPDGGLVAIYTSTAGGEAQSLAYSSDAGRTWDRYAGNPVLPNDGRKDFRDPKVFWHEPTRRWVMVVSRATRSGCSRCRPGRLGGAQSLRGGPRAAPRRVGVSRPVPAAGRRGPGPGAVGADRLRRGQRCHGRLDGAVLRRRLRRDHLRPRPRGPTRDGPGDRRRQDFYAAQSYEHAPDGRRVWIGWMGNWRYPYSAPTTLDQRHERPARRGPAYRRR